MILQGAEVGKRKILRWPKLSYSRLEGGRKREEINCLTESLVKTNKELLTFPKCM